MKRFDLDTPTVAISSASCSVLSGDVSSAADFGVSPRVFAAKYFSSAYELDRSGRHEEAAWVYRSTVETLEEWHRREPRALTNFMLADLALKHGARLMRLRPGSEARIQEAHAAFRTASSHAESALSNGSSTECVEVLAASLSWFGLSARMLGNLEDSFYAFRRSARLWRRLTTFGRTQNNALLPKNRSSYERSLGAVLFGASKTLAFLNQKDEALRCRNNAKVLFQKARSGVC